MKMQLLELLGGVERLLEYHHNSNIVTYPKDQGAASFLEVTARVRRSGAMAREKAALPTETVDPAEPTVLKDSGRFAGQEARLDSLDAIGKEVADCRICGLHQVRIGSRAGSLPSSGVRLMLVGEWLSCPQDMILPDSTQFGLEEDLMVGRMLDAIRIAIDKVFITNIIKCAVPETCKPTAEEAGKCMAYLQRQIVAIAPEMICCMGLMAARTLLGGTLPLSRLRGTFHPFSLPGMRQVPVVVTYHPTFLLQNPTMKKAAWDDLQSIGRFLKT